MKKTAFFVSLMLASCTLLAEVLIKENAETGNNNFNEPFQVAENAKNGKKAFLVKGLRSPITKAVFKIDPEKYYVASVWVKSATDKPSYAFLGLIPYDAQGRNIESEHFSYFPNTLTELAAPSEEGSNIIKVKDARDWKAYDYCVVAFDAKEDLSDLPNRVLSEGIQSIERKDDYYEITLKKALQKNYPAGTKVREHFKGGYFYVKYGDVPTEWTKWESRKYKGSELRRGNMGKLVLLCNHGRPDQSMFFDDLMIEEVPAE